MYCQNTMILYTDPNPVSSRQGTHILYAHLLYVRLIRTQAALGYCSFFRLGTKISIVIRRQDEGFFYRTSQSCLIEQHEHRAFRSTSPIDMPRSEIIVNEATLFYICQLDIPYSGVLVPMGQHACAFRASINTVRTCFNCPLATFAIQSCTTS
jgi:hypothetical protein